MTQPITEVDARFSEPQSTGSGWDDTRRVLQSAELFWITTVRSDGRPHATPLVAVWLDDALHFCTGAGEQKALNLSANPHVLLITGSIRWESGLDVVVEGDALREMDEAKLGRLAEAWAGKWDGRWKWEARDRAFHHPEHGQALVFSVQPTKVLVFAEGKFSHTRHRF